MGKCIGYLYKYQSDFDLSTTRNTIHCPNRFFGVNMPLSSKYFSASSTDLKTLVAVSVMNGLGCFLGFQTT